jgi:cytochrome c553
LLVFSPGWASGADTVEAKLASCLACHGEKGQSATPGVPSLGGQPDFFLMAQLVMFREKIRAIEPMTQMTQGLSDKELRSMAGAISRLPAPQPSGSADPARMERARALIEQHRCNFCHKRDYSGEQNAPRLAGQREDYLVKALRDYKNDARRAYDPSMADVLVPLGDDDLADLAYFLARFR